MRSGVVSVSERATLHSVERALLDHGVHGVLVTADDGAPAGWVTVRGLLRNAARDWTMATAAQAISEPVVKIAPSATGAEALAAMLTHDVGRLLVVPSPSGTPEGVISELDLVRATAD